MGVRQFLWVLLCGLFVCLKQLAALFNLSHSCCCCFCTLLALAICAAMHLLLDDCSLTPLSAVDV